MDESKGAQVQYSAKLKMRRNKCGKRERERNRHMDAKQGWQDKCEEKMNGKHIQPVGKFARTTIGEILSLSLSVSSVHFMQRVFLPLRLLYCISSSIRVYFMSNFHLL